MAKRLEDVLSNFDEMEQELHQDQNVFAVTDLESAAEAQRRMVYYMDKYKEIQEIMKKQIEPFLEKVKKIEEWAKEANDPNVERIEHYEHLLERFFRDQIIEQERAGKKPKKNLPLPYGKLTLKKQQPEFTKDEDVLLDYALENGLVKIADPKTDWAELKKKCKIANGKMYDENGEEVPGVVVTERDDIFEIKWEG